MGESSRDEVAISQALVGDLPPPPPPPPVGLTARVGGGEVVSLTPEELQALRDRELDLRSMLKELEVGDV